TNPVPGFQGTLVILFPGVPVSHPGLIGDSPASPAKSARVPCQRQSEASAPPCQSKHPPKVGISLNNAGREVGSAGTNGVHLKRPGVFGRWTYQPSEGGLCDHTREDKALDNALG